MVVGGVAYAVTRGDDDPSADPSDPPSSSETESPSEPTASEPSEPTTANSATGPASGSDEEAAVASLTDALETTGGLSPAIAECTAESWIEGAGLQEMIDAGLFDADMNYVDVDQADLPPDIAAAASSAALGCATAQ